MHPAPPTFEWDAAKDAANLRKHGVRFADAQYAFADRHRLVLRDLAHGQRGRRYYCIGRMGGGVLTVRFTLRDGKIRIFGAGYWRQGRKLYEKTNPLRE
jgi:uncharacterized protein